jgi:hypothetical protein
MKIKSFEDACAKLGIEPVLPEVSGLMPAHQKSIIAFYKLSIIISALNEGWQPNWLDTSERKWFNWWYAGLATYGAIAGLVSVFSYHSASDSAADFGSRLCFKTESLADYAAENFKDLYEDYLLFN